MTVERMTVSLEADLATAVRHAAEADDQNVSSWLAEAARRQLAARGLRDVIAAWEAEHGAFRDDELSAAGLLCGESDTADIIDASVALTAAAGARHGDVAVVTSDPDDIRHLLSVLDVAARVVAL